MCSNPRVKTLSVSIISSIVEGSFFGGSSFKQGVGRFASKNILQSAHIIYNDRKKYKPTEQDFIHYIVGSSPVNTSNQPMQQSVTRYQVLGQLIRAK